MIFDLSLVEMYDQFYFLKKEANFSLNEMLNLYPHEFEIFYYMAVRDVKNRIEINQGR